MQACIEQKAADFGEKQLTIDGKHLAIDRNQLISYQCKLALNKKQLILAKSICHGNEFSFESFVSK